MVGLHWRIGPVTVDKRQESQRWKQGKKLPADIAAAGVPKDVVHLSLS